PRAGPGRARPTPGPAYSLLRYTPCPLDHQPRPTHEEAVAMATEAMRGTLMERLGIGWLELGPERIVARMPVEGNTQVYGLLHGGATAALVESVGSIGTAVVAGLDKRVAGIHLSVDHLRAAAAGHVTATAVPLRVGRSVAVWDVRVEDDAGELVAVGRLTVSIRSA
ncbi:MAG TPA: PaaI family thioesterase, partial [Actinomycetota bacterium]|nr:PaaI family thioesterase [Actinomycetota bacterium]